jgi:hypothetical protein
VLIRCANAGFIEPFTQPAGPALQHETGSPPVGHTGGPFHVAFDWVFLILRGGGQQFTVNRIVKIQLERATVEFRKRWARDQRQRSGIIIKEKDEERIKSDLADLLDEVLKREMSSKAGYVFVDESGADVMRVIPRVVDLDVVAPDRVRDYIGYALTDSQGSMTLELEFYDSLNGKLLATTSQYQEDPIKGYMEWTTSVTNRQAARHMLERWTNWLREWLDEARVGTLD